MSTVHWPAVIGVIRNQMTVSEIADAVDCQPSTITELEAGRTAEPKYRLGERLLALHKEIVRKRA